MAVPLETILGWVVTGIAFVGHAFVANYRLAQLEKIVEQHSTIDTDAFKEVWEWKDTHEKDAIKTRELFQGAIAKLEGANLVVGEQFKQIMAILTEIKDRISALENYNRGRNS